MWLQSLNQDVRFALRQLRKSPGFTAAAVLSLAIGIGANTAIFSSMDAVVLRPLAVPRLDRVMTAAEQQNGGDAKPVTLADYRDWSRESRSFGQMAAYNVRTMSLTGAGDAAHVDVSHATPSFFDVFQTPALMGRVFTADEATQGKDAVAVLSYGFWTRRFAADPAVLGRRVQLDQREYTVVGVMPKTMQYPAAADLYVPLAATAQQMADRTAHEYMVVGRLREGVSVRQAQDELRETAARLAQAYPASNRGWSTKVEPLLDIINGDLTPMYYKLIMGATLFVLLVVCANVANLQMARGLARRPEVAMRTALGASRVRILRQLLTENVLLALFGSLGGVIFASLYLKVTLWAMPERIAHYMSGWASISINGRALGFSLLLAGLAGVVAGFAPAAESLRVNLVDQLKAGSRSALGARGNKLRSIFAVAQIALAVALVIGAVLMAKGMNSMLHWADNYDPGHALTLSVTLPEARYDTTAKRAQWYAAALERLRVLPGVKNAEVTTNLPYRDFGWLQDVAIENRPAMPGKAQSALRMPVSQGYFNAFHVRVVDGRGFNSGDTLESTPVAVVSRRFVAQYFPGQNPIGRRIRMGVAKDEPWLRIVGVSDEVSYSLWEQTPRAAVYMSTAQVPPAGATLVMYTAGDPLTVAPAARKALAALDAGLPLDGVQTYASLVHDDMIGLMYAASMLGLDALIALLLAAVGIFAVMAHQVGERTREIGVRLAMGARREDVLRMMLRKASWLTATGVGAGVAMAWALAHMVANLLRGVRADDPLVFTGITATIAAIALVACWIPARRASRVDPMVALRDE